MDARISLTEFVDFTLKTGSPKLTLVETIHRRHTTEAYSPATDFWRGLREGLTEHHGHGNVPGDLDQILDCTEDPERLVHYRAALGSYKSWLRAEPTCGWFEPARTDWPIRDLEVRLNPELGLVYPTGRRRVVKLYFKDEKLTAHRLATVLTLLEVGLRGRVDPGCEIGLLDVRRGRFHPTSSAKRISPTLLEAEAMSFLWMWQAVSRPTPA